MYNAFYEYRRQIILYFFICIAIVTVFFGVRYLMMFQDITIVYSDNGVSSAVLYQGTITGSSDPSTIQSSGKEVANPIVSGKKYHIKKGNYYIKISGKNIESADKGIILANKPQSYSFSNYDYSTSYLQSLLTPSLEQSIQSVIVAKYPTLPSLYTFQDGALYKQGNWYGVALVWIGDPSSLSRDTLKIVAHKNGNTWQVATEPNILLSSKDYPSVPKDVLDSINDVDQNTPLMPNFTLY